MANPGVTASVDRTATAIGIREALGDRAFTTIDESYDPHSFALLSATRHASCCGSSWDSTVTRNGDGTYAIENRRDGPFGTYTERLERAKIPPDAAILIGNQLLAPAIVERGRHTLLLLAFEPIRLIAETVVRAPRAVDPPARVPPADRLMALQELRFEGSVVTYLWYDPCTLRVDAVERHA